MTSRKLHEQSVKDIVTANPLVLFVSDDDGDSYMMQSVLSNIGATSLKTVNLTGTSETKLRLKQELMENSGQLEMPYLYFKGKSLGQMEFIIETIKTGDLQKKLNRAGLPVLMKHQTPSLDRNIYGYPKGGLTAEDDKRNNILLCACGSSAADKIPELVKKLKAEGHDVKLVPSMHAEHFFSEFGMEQIHNVLNPTDIYRDEDEWNFRYEDKGMEVRACHLALCDWADCVIVAPVTCNTMGNIANGIATNLLTSLFVAWQYQSKPVIFAPACNTHMWNNITTQRNVEFLKQLGIKFVGPRKGILSNGTEGIGMMATVSQITKEVFGALKDLAHQDITTMRWGRQAAASDDPKEWKRVYRKIDERDEHGNRIVDINVSDRSNGDTLLHYAAGGEGRVSERGIRKGVPDIDAAKQLIRRKIDINKLNNMHFTPLHVAIMNDSPEMVSLLLDHGADPELKGSSSTSKCAVELARSKKVNPKIVKLLDAQIRKNASAAKAKVKAKAKPKTKAKPKAKVKTR